MNQNLQAIVEETIKDNSSFDQTFFLGGALIIFNIVVMLMVGLYWMNPVIHQFFSGRPLL